MTVATVFYISVPIVKILSQSTQPSQKMKEGVIMTMGRLGYNSAIGWYGLLVSDLWEDTGFHCGECLEVMVDGKWEATRIERSAEWKWNLVGTPSYGTLEYVQARI